MALIPGSRGDQVRQLQLQLQKNYPDITVDGIYGSETQDYVRQFQHAMGLPETGTADDDTISLLQGQDAPTQVREAAPPASPPAPIPAAPPPSRPLPPPPAAAPQASAPSKAAPPTTPPPATPPGAPSPTPARPVVVEEKTGWLLLGGLALVATLVILAFSSSEDQRPEEQRPEPPPYQPRRR